MTKVKRYGTGPNYKKVYLIAPKHPDNFWSMQGTADILGARTLMPNSALATLMALTPDHLSIEYELADENVTTIEFDNKCDLIAITGATLHSKRIVELCHEFKSRGNKIALGGTFASIEPDKCEGLADHLFIGEAELTWPLFLKEWVDGDASSVYKQPDYIDMTTSPPPDWSLINVKDYVNINVQTSRGCPNRCDFCDVIQYVGRHYRTKSINQIMGEIKNAYSIGARTIFFSDDNFLGKKQFTRELLTQLIDWNRLQTRPLSFSTQITVQVADDEELLKLFAEARFSVLFLGVETVRKESLDEVQKGQNCSKDLYERIRRISKYGIVPFIGLIVGFDNDDETVFEDLEHFLNETGSPIAGISLLNAPRNTPLYHRMEKENRLIKRDFSGEWQLATNIVPKQMTSETLIQNYLSLFRKLYQPAAFEERFLDWLKQVDYYYSGYDNKKLDPKQLKFGFRIFHQFLVREDREVRQLFLRMVRKTWRINPKLMKRFFTVITQFKHFYSFVKTMDVNYSTQLETPKK